MLAVMAIVATGCERDTVEQSERRLVVEGTLNSDGYPEIFLTLSAAADASGGVVADNVVRWGVVTLSDGDQEVILTGGPRPGLVPPFMYYSFDMQGEPGKTYLLTAEYDGMKVSSSVTMPAPTPVGGIISDAVAGNENLRTLTLWFTAPDDCPAYYHVSTRVNGKDSRFYPCVPGTVAVNEKGTKVEMPVIRGTSGFKTDDNNDNFFRVGDKVTVRLARVAPDVFNFWRAWDNAALTGGSVFVGSSISLPTNITGGYGVWSPQGVTDVNIEIR